MTPDAVRWILFQTLPEPVIHGLGDPDEIAELLAPLGDDAVHAIVGEIPAAWPVSQILTLDILHRFPEALACIGTDRIHDWVNGALDRYESEGLSGARVYLGDTEGQFLCRVAGERGMHLAEVRDRLGLYLTALAGRPMTVEEGSTPATDGRQVFLPGVVDLGTRADRSDHRIFFRYAATVQWAATRYGTFLLSDPGSFFAGFPRRELAVFVWNIVETVRLGTKIGAGLPGLDRDMRAVVRVLPRLPDPGAAARPGEEGLPGVLCRLVMGAADPDGESGRNLDRYLDPVRVPGCSVGETRAVTGCLYDLMESALAPDEPLPDLPAYGLNLGPDGIARARQSVRRVLREEYVDVLGTILVESRPETSSGSEEDGEEDGSPGAPTPPKEGGTAALILDPGRTGSKREPVENGEIGVTTIHGETDHRLAGRLEELARQVRNDLGGVPAEYVAAAQGMAGRGLPLARGLGEGREKTSLIPGDGWLYDEWDARRNDYRKQWCRVVELPAPTAGGNFVETTLANHRGTVGTLRRQFEMLRRQERYLKRQPDGDEIDLDAFIEALNDQRAGLSPSDRVFIRLQRTERDIATLFLVDMSASTEGWVSTTIKESLVLLCEALERLGDRYGIFGFSGMRRTRSEWYPVKLFDEAYDREVKRRITGIVPRDYTRMGSAIRHATSVLDRQENRVRLLLVLSDGKPEDYDDYKGAYAVEDTRKALIEARLAGVSPFCITVDREAREYLPHMFGEHSYALVSDVRLLPARLPEIYRVVTT